MGEEWKKNSSEEIIDSDWVKVRKDSVSLPNGTHIDDFYVVSLKEASAIVALDDEGNIVLKSEYRYTYEKDLIEVPAGGFEKGESDALIVAKRELLEETGYISNDWQYLGSTIESSSKLTNHMHIYFANHCKKVGEQKLDPTEELKVMVIPFSEAIEMVMENRICCNSSAHGILKVARMLGK